MSNKEAEHGRFDVCVLPDSILGTVVLIECKHSISEDDLIVPHPDMKNRDFVLKPLMQIAPYKLHPVYRKTISDMYAELMAKKQ